MDEKEWIVFLCATVEEILDAGQMVAEDSQLMGRGGLLTSMSFVELMLAIEDRCRERSLVFDWTNDSAMSERRSVYRDVASLAAFLSTLPREHACEKD